MKLDRDTLQEIRVEAQTVARSLTGKNTPIPSTEAVHWYRLAMDADALDGILARQELDSQDEEFREKARAMLEVESAPPPVETPVVHRTVSPNLEELERQRRRHLRLLESGPRVQVDGGPYEESVDEE
jgi:hypothetical protein